MTTLAGLVVVLMILAQRIAALFDLVKTLFSFSHGPVFTSSGPGYGGRGTGLVVQKQAKRFPSSWSLPAAPVILALAAWFWSQWWIFVTELRLLGQLDGATVTILLKTAGVGLLAELAGAVCEDAGDPGQNGPAVAAVQRPCTWLCPYLPVC